MVLYGPLLTSLYSVSVFTTMDAGGETRAIALISKAFDKVWRWIAPQAEIGVVGPILLGIFYLNVL